MEILERIINDLKDGVLITADQVFHQETAYYPMARSYGSGKFNNDGKLKSLSFPVQHPSILTENNKLRRSSAFLDLPSAIAAMYQKAARDKMQKDYPSYAPDDFCILPTSVVVEPDVLKLHIQNGMYADTRTAPNWHINVPEKIATVKINNVTYGKTTVSSDTMRIFASNCPNPVVILEVDWQNNTGTFKNDGTKMSLEYAAEKLAGDPKIMRIVPGMSDEIVEKRLKTLWNFFAERSLDSDYFVEEVYEAFLDDALKSLFPPAAPQKIQSPFTF